MKFEEALLALKAGEKIRRKYWYEKRYIKMDFRFVVGKIVNQDSVIYALTIMDLVAYDWEIVKEKKKVKLRDLTEEQYEKWKDKNCGKYDCLKCPFRCVDCNKTFWMSCKDMYSDKILDQEIEVEQDD